MAIVALDCTTTAGILRIIKLLIPKCGVELSDDDMCAIIDSAASPTDAGSLIFTILASRAAGISSLRIGATSISGGDLCNKLKGIALDISANGLPGCPVSEQDASCTPCWDESKDCSDLYPGRFSHPLCGGCGKSKCGGCK